MTYDEINSGSCFDKLTFKLLDNKCNSFNQSQKESNCKNNLKRNPVYNRDLYCVPELKTPFLKIKNKNINSVDFKLIINDDSGDFYKINFNDLIFYYEILYDDNKINGEVTLENYSSPNPNIPYIRFKNEVCDENNCIILELLNLSSNKTYKLKIKYKTDILNNTGVNVINNLNSDYSEELEFTTSCDIDSLKVNCRNVCGSNKDEVCGPSDSDPKNINHKDPTVNTWPFYKTINTESCECANFSDSQKKVLCSNISMNNSSKTFVFRNNNCIEVLNNDTCKNDRDELDPVYHQYFSKVPDKETDFTTCTLPKKNKLKKYVRIIMVIL